MRDFGPVSDEILAQAIDAALDRPENGGLPREKEPGWQEIVYIEGLNPDGTKNHDRPNRWNDLRTIILHDPVKGPILIHKAKATTEPGDKWTYRPMKPTGAARIRLNKKFWAWKIGKHRGTQDALIQIAGPVDVYRDRNMDFVRTGDKMFSGWFGINQHHGYNLKRVGRASAGCLVGQSVAQHEEFMKQVRKDVRYAANLNHTFSTIVLKETDILKEIPYILGMNYKPKPKPPSNKTVAAGGIAGGVVATAATGVAVTADPTSWQWFASLGLLVVAAAATVAVGIYIYQRTTKE